MEEDNHHQTVVRRTNESEELTPEQQQLYTNVITLLKQEKYYEVEEALEQLFLSDYDASGDQIGEILKLMAEKKNRIYDCFAYNTFLLAVLHSMIQFQWNEHVRTILNEVYTKATPRDMFFIQKNIVKTTQDVPTLVHSLTFLPDLFQSIGEERKMKTLSEMKEQIVETMKYVNGYDERERFDDPIEDLVARLVPLLPSHGDSVTIIMTLLDGRYASQETVKRIQDIFNGIDTFPNTFLSFTPKQLLTYIGINCSVPMIINPHYLYNALEDAILDVGIPSSYSLALLKQMIACHQSKVHADVLLALYKGISQIQTEDIEVQKRIVALFEKFIFMQSGEGFALMIKTIFS